MIGQYTEQEMMEMSPDVKLSEWRDGHIIRLRGKTINYYRREVDGSWTNYHCRSLAEGHPVTGMGLIP